MGGIPCIGLNQPGVHVFTQWLHFPPTVQRHADYRSTGNSTAPVGVNVFVSLHACLLRTGMRKVQGGYELFHFLYFHAILKCVGFGLSGACHYVLIRKSGVCSLHP